MFKRYGVVRKMFVVLVLVLVVGALCILKLFCSGFGDDFVSRRIVKTIAIDDSADIASTAKRDDDRLKNNGNGDVIVIYNRIPKTGSTSFVNVAYDLCKRNSFNVIHLNVTKNSHTLSLSDQVRLVHNISNWNAKKPALYHGHVGFIDFEKFGASSPIYVNLLRKPLDRLVSYYYFLRYGDDYRPHLIRKKHGNKVTFDECVEQQKPDCHPDNMWLQIPFLCGQHAFCWIPGNEYALQQAKFNLANKYTLVGVTEDISSFISILETVLPHMFKGASEHFAYSHKNHLRKTIKKISPSEKTKSVMKKSPIWQMENELYEFATRQFQFLKSQMKIFENGTAVDKGIQFRFEKIYPK